MLSTRYFPIYFLLGAFLGSIVFLPALTGGFVLDDGVNILQNRLLYLESLSFEGLVNAALSFHDGNGARPLPMLSFSLDYWREGRMNSTAFKTTNLVIHGLTTFFMACFLRRLLLLADWDPSRAVVGALAMALIWAAHPMQVSSVMYIVQRMQTMETLFLVLALWAYLGMRQTQMAGTSRGHMHGLLVLLFWSLALACKEDAPLLIAFFLALELTILRFRAKQPDITKGIIQSYLLLAVLGAIAYFFIVIPHYWSWETHSGRNFTTPERLLTQARVLVMYLWQILLPYPENLTFIYDTLPVSRGLWRPWTTLYAVLIVVFCLAWAWRWRTRRPVFSFGVLLYFSGHFITSNVIPLELVFEHRNHFPLIGVVLAVSDLVVMAWQRWGVTMTAKAVWVGAAVLVLGLATLSHAYTWGDSVRHGEKLVKLLPESVRAWTQLAGAHFDRYNATKDEVHLMRAIEVNEAGLHKINSPSLASNLVIYKSLLGTIADDDWQRFLKVLQNAPPGWQNKQVLWTLMNNVDRGFDINAARVVDAIYVVRGKAGFDDLEYLRLAIFIYKNGEPDKAFPYFIRFAEQASPDSVVLDRIIGELDEAGYGKWAEQMRDILRRKAEGISL